MSYELLGGTHALVYKKKEKKHFYICGPSPIGLIVRNILSPFKEHSLPFSYMFAAAMCHEISLPAGSWHDGQHPHQKVSIMMSHHHVTQHAGTVQAATLCTCTKQRARRYHQQVVQEDSTRLPINQAQEVHNASTDSQLASNVL